MNAGTASATGLSGALKGVQASATMATGGIRAMTAALISSGIGAIVVAVGALAAGFISLVRGSAEFGQEMSNLKAVLGDKGDEISLKELSDDAKRLGASTAFTAVQVAQLQTEFAKLGFTTDEILNVTEATLNLAAASGTDLAEAATIAGSTLRGFGLNSTQTARVVDVMALSFSSSSLDIDKFKESMKLVAPIAKTVKVTVEEASAALSVMANAGVSGSMAGTQLRRVMSDLATKTGKSFNESLKITAQRLEAATSDAEKLAIAKELVGDRAKGTLISLAENVDQLDELTLAYGDAEGAAAAMAETKLDNLKGDVTKLSSAWEGFKLGLEDGEGIMSRISRGAVQVLTAAIMKLGNFLDGVSLGFNLMGHSLKNIAIPLKLTGEALTRFGLKIQALFEKFTIAQQKFYGNDEQVAVYEEKLKETEAALEASLERTLALQTAKGENEAERAQMIEDFKNRHEIRAQKETDALKAAQAEEFREGEAKADEEAANKALEDKKAFLDKLKKQGEDAEDVTTLDKINRAQARHLAELESLVMTETEKEEARQAILDLYEQKRENNRQKEADREAKAAERRTAKEAQENERRLQDEARAQRERMQLMYNTLDTVSNLAGEETKIARAAQAMKLAMQLEEMRQKFITENAKLVASATTAQAEAAIDGAKTGVASARGMAETMKAGFPQNIPLMIAYGVQAASMIAAFSKSKKTLDSVTSSAGGSGGGITASAPAAPSFNVLGASSAGDNMITGAIQGMSDRPVRAYVLESEVTSAQSLQRNASDMASVG
tara:strand:+ start:1338 stop:3686 length:2349 start_codon:yes stop_codon:yes gene_type:complete